MHKIRPLAKTDLDIVLQWRNSKSIRRYMYNDHVISLKEHRAWFAGLVKDPNRHCLIFEIKGKPAGVINIYDIDKKNQRCEWGFYLGERTVPRGSGTIMGYMALQFIFEQLRIRKLCSTAFAFNRASVLYHQKLNFRQEGRFLRHAWKNGRYQDVIAFGLFKKDWIHVREAIRLKYLGREEK